MNKILVLALSILLLTPILSYANDAHHDDAKVPSKTSSTAKQPNEKTASPMMMDSMKKMQDQMVKIRATKDATERDTLLQEHMQTMQETMKMMHDSKGMMAGAKKDGKHMDMMQMMMDQMMDHQKAMQGTGK